MVTIMIMDPLGPSTLGIVRERRGGRGEGEGRSGGIERGREQRGEGGGDRGRERERG